MRSTWLDLCIHRGPRTVSWMNNSKRNYASVQIWVFVLHGNRVCLAWCYRLRFNFDGSGYLVFLSSIKHQFVSRIDQNQLSGLECSANWCGKKAGEGRVLCTLLRISKWLVDEKKEETKPVHDNPANRSPHTLTFPHISTFRLFSTSRITLPHTILTRKKISEHTITIWPKE